MEETTDAREREPAMDRPQTVRGQFDWSETEPAVAAVETVALATDQRPLDVYGLEDAIDGDALNELLRSSRAEAGNIEVTFSFSGCSVTVRCDGLVEAEFHERR